MLLKKNIAMCVLYIKERILLIEKENRKETEIRIEKRLSKHGHSMCFRWFLFFSINLFKNLNKLKYMASVC
jgi:hypothetical protein